MGDTTSPQPVASPSTRGLSDQYESIRKRLEDFLDKPNKTVDSSRESTNSEPKHKETTVQSIAHFLEDYYFRLSMWSNDMISIDPFKEISIVDILKSG